MTYQNPDEQVVFVRQIKKSRAIADSAQFWDSKQASRHLRSEYYLISNYFNSRTRMRAMPTS